MKRGLVVMTIIGVICTSFGFKESLEVKAQEKNKAEVSNETKNLSQDFKEELKDTKEYKINNNKLDKNKESLGEKGKADYLNKANYPLVKPFSSIGLISTTNGELFSLSYEEIKENSNNTEEMVVWLSEFSYDKYIYNDVTTIEFFKEVNGKLEYAGASQFELDWTLQKHGTRLVKKEFAEQEYIYMRIGKSRNSWDDYYTGTRLVKVRNEFYEWKNHWAKEYIKKAMELGWVETAVKFRPNDSITRAEFVKIANRAFGYKEPLSKNPFIDIGEKDWYYNEVKIAAKAGYISIENGKFRPNDRITREEVAAIVTTIEENKDSNLDKIKKFKDFSKISKWAQSSVEGAVENGYMGKGGEYFNPRSNITRAESIVTIGRIKNIVRDR